ncbi:MAG: LysR family transcriptional regulator [Actinomycetia bacterium]|nr:LysR family transcriptional regulator [Actinomycetes bacterium]MCP4958965.1 LysR family transcriptional regulator [Actinomycetes bacterium]
MDLRQLRTVIHVAELGSLSKAAERLHIAQPALSRQVRRLERDLGVELFERHGRGMHPTDAALDILDHARNIMGELDSIRAVAAVGHVPLRGHVSIGMPPTAGDILTVPIATAFSESHPDATLRIVNAYSRYLQNWLQRGELDVAILFDGPALPSLQSVPLVEEELFLIGSADDDLDPDAPVAFDDLVGVTLLLPSHGHGLRDLIDDIARTRSIELHTSIEADSYLALKSLVKAGRGLTILPLAPIHDEIRSGQLSFAPIVDVTPRRRLVLSLPSERPSSPLARFIASTVESTIPELIGTGAWPGAT